MDKKEQTINNIASNIANLDFNAMEDIVKVDTKEDTKNNVVKTLTSGTSKANETLKTLSSALDSVINGYKYKNGKDRKDNFITTFKIDADLERYLINIDSITLIDAVNNDNANFSTTIQDYLNDLIRADLKKRFNISAKETDSQKWINALNDFCNKYKLPKDAKDKNKK